MQGQDQGTLVVHGAAAVHKIILHGEFERRSTPGSRVAGGDHVQVGEQGDHFFAAAALCVPAVIIHILSFKTVAGRQL
jgi:hypothetical protein